MTSDPHRECPEHFDERRIAALADGDVAPEEGRVCLEHLEGCEVCAGLYAAHVKLLDLEAAEAGVAVGKKPGRISALAAWCRRPANAAAILIALFCGVAAGSLLTPVRGVFLGQTEQGGVALWQSRGFEFETLGISGSAEVFQRIDFAIAGRGVGILFAIEDEGSGGVNLCAFDGQGRALWSAERAWADYAQVAGLGGIRFYRLSKLNTGKHVGQLEQSFVLVIRRGRQTGVIAGDPQTGVRRRSVFYDGAIRDEIQTMPEEEDGLRPILLGGFRGSGFRAEPILLVLGGDGEVRQQVVLPVLMKGRIREAAVEVLQANWRTQPPRVRIGVSRNVIFGVDWRDGRLDLESTSVVGSDRLGISLRNTYEPESLETLLDELGGPEDWPKGLAAAVREVSGGVSSGWRIR